MGLSCSESELLAHNADVSSACGIQNIINMLGKSCYRFSGDFGAISRNIPAIAGDRCFYSSTTRVTLEQYSCIEGNNQRLCYCSGISKTFWIQIVCFGGFSLYSSFFTETTNTNTIEDGLSYLGCYKDSGGHRIWNGGNQGGSNQNSPRRWVQTDNPLPQVHN